MTVLAARQQLLLQQLPQARAIHSRNGFDQGRLDELEALGLEAPLAAKVASELRKSGVKLPQDIITDEELAQALCQ